MSERSEILHSLPAAALIFLLVPVMLLFSPLSAVENDGLSLPEVLQLAKDNNLSLRQQRLLVEQAEAEIAIQQTGYFPAVSASSLSTWVFFNKPPVNTSGENDRVSINIFSLGIEQPIFTGFRTANRIHMAEERYQSQQSTGRTVEDRLLLQAGLVYYDLQLNLLSQDVLHQSLSRTRNQLEKTRQLLAADQVTWFDTLEAANRQLEIATALHELEGLFKILKDKLAHLLNITELPGISLHPVSPPADRPMDPATLKQIAVMNRPELRTIRAGRNLQQYQIEMNKAAFYPVVSASAGYNYGHMDGLFFAGEWIDFYNIMINFQWELWDWNRDRDKVQQAKLEHQRLDLEEQQLLLDITSEIREIYEQGEIITRQSKMQDRLYRQEKERFDITHERYQQGLTTALDLSSAEHALTSAQLKLQRTYIDWHKNNLRLRYATGQIGDLTQEGDK